RCFFFSSRRRHTRSTRDWSSDVCSSDLRVVLPQPDSPTRPTVSPASTSRLTLSTALTQPCRTRKYVRRFRTDSNGTLSPSKTWVDNLVEAAAEEVEPEREQSDREAGWEQPQQCS